MLADNASIPLVIALPNGAAQLVLLIASMNAAFWRGRVKSHCQVHLDYGQ